MKFCSKRPLDLNDSIDLFQIQKTNYVINGTLDEERVLKDMEKTFVYTNCPILFYVKVLEGNSMKLCVRNDKEMNKTLKSIVVGESVNNIPSGKNTFKQITEDISLYTLFNEGVGIDSNKLRFLVKNVRFISDDPDTLSLFRGYPFKPLKMFDLSKIDLWLNHVLKVISNDDVEMYEFILNWISFIVQNPGEKTETALLLISEQGAGKNQFFTDIICKLLGNYAIPNENKIENIAGRFNSSIENKVLIIANELQSIENVRYLNSDALKSVITEKRITYDAKNINVREGENVANFIFVSNNNLPLKLEKGDRRYAVSHCSVEMKDRSDYFEPLIDEINSNGFYENLFTYLSSRNISKWNKRKIPETELRNDIIDACKENWLLFFEEYVDKFYDKGYLTKDCYSDYRLFCEESGTNPFSLKTFGLKIKSLVDIVQTGVKDEKGNWKTIRHYRIKENIASKYMKCYNDNEIDETK